MSDQEKQFNNQNEYNADDFDAYEGLEAIREDTSMYLDGTGMDGIMQLFVEVVDNVVDESNNLKGLRIGKGIIEFSPDGTVVVSDNGRGIPVDVNSKFGIPAVRLAFEKMHSGGKLKRKGQVNTSAYQNAIGTHGIGLSAVNACSELLEITIKRNGKVYRLAYSKGKLIEDLHVIGECSPEETGTTVKFRYDPEVLQPFDSLTGVQKYPFYMGEVLERLENYVTFNENVEFEIKWNTGDEPSDMKTAAVGDKYFAKEEYSPFAIIRKFTPDERIFDFTGKSEESGVEYEVEGFISFTERYADTVKLSSVNGLRMTEGGTHEEALQDEVYRFFNRMMQKALDTYELDRSEVIGKLNYVILLKTPHKEFKGQTKNYYANDKIAKELRSDYQDILANISTYASDIIKRTYQAILADYQEKVNQRKKYEEQRNTKLVKKDKKKEADAVAGDFADCANGPRLRDKNSVWFVEGDSASGPFVNNRDIKTEAILALQGKPLNVNKSDYKKIQETKVFKQIRYIVDLNKFSKYVIATDADTDGLHIRNLIALIFMKFFPDIIDRGQLLIALPPLYRLKKGQNLVFAIDDEEAATYLKQGYSMDARFKGLGEMRPTEFYDQVVVNGRFIRVSSDNFDQTVGDLDFTHRQLIDQLTSRDTSFRKDIVLSFASDRYKEYCTRKSKIKREISSRVNPLHIHDDGTPMTQFELDMIHTDDIEEEWDDLGIESEIDESSSDSEYA